MEHKNIEDKVINMYKKVNPSFRDISNSNIFDKQISNRKAILKELNLPSLLFKEKKLLEIGAGTGENSLYYAMMGADVTIVEPNELSCKRTEELFESYSYGITIINQSLFEMDQTIFKEFDIVISEGVLHHTFDTMNALNIVLSNVSNETIVMVSIPEYHGWYKRNLQRLLISELSNSEEEIVLNSKKYFQNHVDRAKKYGLREEKNIIYDTFVNPQIQTTPLERICDTFYTNGIEYYSSYPTMNLFMETAPWSKKKENRFNYKCYQDYYRILEKIWMCSGEENLMEEMGHFDQLLDRIETESDALTTLEKKLKQKHLRMLI